MNKKSAQGSPDFLEGIGRGMTQLQQTFLSPYPAFRMSCGFCSYQNCVTANSDFHHPTNILSRKVRDNSRHMIFEETSWWPTRNKWKLAPALLWHDMISFVSLLNNHTSGISCEIAIISPLGSGWSHPLHQTQTILFKIEAHRMST